MNQFYKLSLFLAALLPARWASAQEQTPATFTLEQCIEYALENSNSIKNSAIDQQIALAKVRETVGIGLPQINGDVGVNHNTQLQRFFSRKATSYGFSSASNRNSPDFVPYDQFLPNLKDDDVLASPNFFQLPSNAQASVSINQIIFSGSYLVGLQASKTYRELSVKNALQTKEQVIEQVTKAFYSSLINLERMKLFGNNIARVDSLLRNTTALNTNGFAESIDVDRVQVTLNNLITERDKFERLQNLSLELLKFQMNFPEDQILIVSGDLAVLNENLNLDAYLKDLDYKNRPDYQILETNRKLQSLNIKNKHASSMPSLSANANFGYGTQSTNISGIFITNSNISDNGQVGPDKWYPFGLIGVSLHVPIFSGLQRNYQLQQEKLSLQKIDNSFKVLKSSVDIQIKQSVASYQNSIQALEAQKRNMDLAQKIARVTKIKYTQGVGSNLEVVDAESGLKESQVNYYSALYDVLVAKVDIDKAFGKLVLSSPKN
jgi:outer membrane protein TolC